MKRVICKQAVAVLALLAILSLVAPAPAQAAVWGAGSRGAWSDGWTWIASLWEQVAMMFGGGKTMRSPSAVKQLGLVQKSSTTSGGASASSDNGSMINPDGQPPT